MSTFTIANIVELSKRIGELEGILNSHEARISKLTLDYNHAYESNDKHLQLLREAKKELSYKEELLAKQAQINTRMANDAIEQDKIIATLRADNEKLNVDISMIIESFDTDSSVNSEWNILDNVRRVYGIDACIGMHQRLMQSTFDDASRAVNARVNTAINGRI